MMSARLYIGNIPHDASAEALRAVFSEFGPVDDVQVVIDRYSGRPRGFAFVTMARPEDAAAAIAKVNGTMFGGRPVRVSDAAVRKRGETSSNETARGR
jgi:RNA recognition motif-containing protein